MAVVHGTGCAAVASSVSRWLAAASVAVAAAVAAGPSRAAQADLYSATVIVTGRDNLAERSRGIRAALPLVLTKVGADRSLGPKAVAEGLVESAQPLVVGLDYRDRKEGIPISDEQGTRERSFELTVHFDSVRIDAEIRALGGVPWTRERPTVGVALVVRDTLSEYLLVRGSERGFAQRMAFDEQAQALGLPIRLPEMAPAGADPQAARAAAAASMPVLLEGMMEMTPAGYWNTEWHFRTDGADERFALAGTTFDTAIADALGRSAKALAKR